MWKFLLYITNNEARSRHEETFDAIFWSIETLALVCGIWILMAKHLAEWIPFLVIEYCWAWTTCATIGRSRESGGRSGRSLRTVTGPPAVAARGMIWIYCWI